MHALLIAQAIDLSTIDTSDAVGAEPLVIAAGSNGCASVFPYGAVVMFGLSPVEEAKFLASLAPALTNAVDPPETEEIVLELSPDNGVKVESDRILMEEFSLQRIQIIADIMAKSVVLAYYEGKTAQSFDRVEPFAASLQRTNWSKHEGNQLLRQLGNTLYIQHKMVGRVEIIDKPELLWEYPELDRFYLRLEDEYELRERHLTLERKLNLVSRTAETAIELMQHNTNLRVEWYIVLLIVAEILLSIYELFIQT